MKRSCLRSFRNWWLHRGNIAYGLTQSLDLETSSSQYLGANDSASLDVSTNFTLEGSFNPESLITGGKEAPLICKDDGGSGQRSYYLNIIDAGGGVYRLQCFVNGGGANYQLGYITYTFSTATWTHAAVTFDGSQSVANRLTFYINGVDQGHGTNISGGTGATSAANSTAQLRIGAFHHASLVSLGYLFDGKVSLARVWNTTRSQTDIANNMCNVFGTATTGLAAEWSLDGVYTDASGNGNTLTASGSPVFATDVPSTCGAAAPATAYAQNNLPLLRVS